MLLTASAEGWYRANWVCFSTTVRLPSDQSAGVEEPCCSLTRALRE